MLTGASRLSQRLQEAKPLKRRQPQARGFLPAKSLLFLPKTSSAVLTTDAGRPALAAGLYVVLYGGLSSLIPTEGPQEASYKPRPPACGAARDAPADNYGRKQKPTAKKTRKTRQKTKKTLKKPPKKKVCRNSK
jgi:hypothetical protein